MRPRSIAAAIRDAYRDTDAVEVLSLVLRAERHRCADFLADGIASGKPLSDIVKEMRALTNPWAPEEDHK